MFATTSSSHFPEPSRSSWRTNLVNRCWPRVCVESARITPGASGDCARVVVQLGGLTPADVQVELMKAVSASGPSVEYRLFSSHALGNGSFVFEARLPRSDTARTPEWMVHVHPGEAMNDPMVEYRLPGIVL